MFCARSLIIPNLANIYIPNIAKEIFLLLLNLEHCNQKENLDSNVFPTVTSRQKSEYICSAFLPTVSLGNP